MSKFGELVKQYRAVLGVSQEELATQVGTFQSVVSNIERGLEPTPELRTKIVRVLHMPKAFGDDSGTRS